MAVVWSFCLDDEMMNQQTKEKTEMNTEELTKEALARVRQNITDHVFLEIQRDVDLFRAYVKLVADGDETKYREVNSHIAQLVENMVGIDGAKARVNPDCVVPPMSTLIQSFSCFAPDTVCVKP